jgi:hypothetical protein
VSPAPVTVNDHAAFRAGLVPADGEDLDLLPAADVNPPARRKDSEISRVLEIIDNLPTGKDAE